MQAQHFLQNRKLATHNKPLKSGLLAVLLLFINGCANLGDKQVASGIDAKNEGPAPSEEIEYSDFSLEDDTLHDLLVAEIAAQRNQFNLTLLNYIQQARHTRDPGVIRRAINAAQFAKDGLAIKELALLWEEVEPENPSVHQLLAYQYSLEKSYSDAIDHIDKVLALGGRVSVESLAIGTQSLPDDEKLELLGLYEKLLEKYPDNHAVEYSVAIIESNLKRLDDALARLNRIIDQHEDFQPAYVLKSNVLYEKKESEQVAEFLEDAYKKFPTNHSIARLYASVLIDAKELGKAEQVFSELRQAYPKTSGFKLSHALVMLENNKPEEAKVVLKELLDAKLHVDDAHFYLGRIADVQKDPETAIKHYLQIKSGPNQAAARERAIFLLIQDEKYDETRATLDELRAATESRNQKDSLWELEFRLLNSFDQQELAMSTLESALVDNPENEQLLYARAMLKERDGKLEEMEADLKHIIELNPENAIAMNALGYTLADKTDRYEEAQALIAKALEIRPNNPAILDSMGWVLFKTGRTRESLIFLLKAFQAMPDGEIGAHLGEVLLSLNQFTEAYQVWSKSLEIAPEHPVLLETVNRLAPELIKALEGAAKENGDSEEVVESDSAAKGADETAKETAPSI